MTESPLERRARYLRLAGEAKELAAKSKTVQMREACLAMAQSWLALASDVDPGGSRKPPAWTTHESIAPPGSRLSAED